ncbi:MAG: tRNA uridine-5-carboxymethylaminomethyl(34) synthesis GTPase MnmE [Bacteroidota bacterium]
MPHDYSDTIAAIATPPGQGGLSVIRVSGEASLALVSKRFRGHGILENANTHTAHFGKIVEENGSALDEVVCTVFRKPHSYTGEDTVEVSCHGGVLVTKRVLESLVHAGARPAEPGEFTKRAFLNGKMDLSQAEAVADLIHADSDLARSTSLHQLEGSLSRRIQTLRDSLVESIGLLELELDFVEDGLEFVDKGKVERQIETAWATVSDLIQTYKFGRVYREGVKVVLAGAPNVGKSSLMNALLNEDRAIVTDIPGTTRDVIEEVVNIGGIAFRIVDTAGLRESPDPIEQEGVRRTQNQVSTADLLLLMLDSSRELSHEEKTFTQAISVRVKKGELNCIAIYNKIDLGPKTRNFEQVESALGTRGIPISALTGTGLTKLREALIEAVFHNQTASPEKSATVTNVRHYNSLRNAEKGLVLALGSMKAGKSSEFVTVDLRSALDNLGEITGAVTTEDILNDIFSKFCIGK